MSFLFTTERSARQAATDRAVGFMIVVYNLIALATAFYTNTLPIAVVASALSAAGWFVSKRASSDSPLHTFVAACILGLLSALIVYQTNRLSAMHLLAIAAAITLIGYRNWQLFILLFIAYATPQLFFGWIPTIESQETTAPKTDMVLLFQLLLSGATIALAAAWSYQLARMEQDEAQLLQRVKALDTVKENIAFAEEISKGNLSYEAHIAESDDLGRALQKMQTNLAASYAREQDEKYVSLGINKISEILRSKTDNLQALADELIKGMVKYLGLNQGGIFLLEGEGDQRHLHLTACYAYERKKYLEREIALGEGLVGQCFLERDIIFLKEVPANYIRITSGLGDAAPRTVLLAPLQTQDEIVGVIELASLDNIDENKIRLVRKLCEIIASSIISTRVTERVQLLLRDSQQQTEELRAQEEEVRQNMEELQATQEEIERKSKELSAYMTSIDGTMAQIQFEPDGTILSANSLFLKAMGYELDEIRGRHHRMFIDREYALSDDYRKFWEDLGQGKSIQGEFKRFGKGGREVWINATYTPIFHQDGTVQRVIKLAQDVTYLKARDLEMKAELEENLQKAEQLNEIIEKELKVRESVFGYTTILSESDTYGTITFVNDKLCEVSKYKREELLGKPHNIFRHPDMPKELFKLFWDTIKSGRVFHGIVKNRAKDGSHYWVDATIVPVKDEHGQIVKYVGARYHIKHDAMAEQLYAEQLQRIGMNSAMSSRSS
jgi:methyl-accepting chemotaxis protein